MNEDEKNIPEVDEQGRRTVDEYGEPIHWATPKERRWALAGAVAVILITLAMAYAIATGYLFRF